MKFQHKSSEQLHYPLRNLLHSLYNCDMSPLRQYLPNGGNNINELTFFAETRALCTPPACSTFIPSEGYDRLRCYHRCRDTSLDKMAETCRMYSHVVMKTVRILDLSVLFTLLEDPALDLRILHLVRDPRAVALSRTYFILDIEDHIVLKKEGNENITISRVMEKICRSQVHINNVAKAAQALQGRYMAIRYEDLALEPLKSINKIYRFASLHPTEDLEQWAYNITHQEQEEKNGVMTFSRESSKVVQRWRTSLGFDFVEEIQESCKEAMVLFGYFPAQSKSEQRNLTLDLVDKEWSID
ncbi:carbohydrate sulfotransferase 6-like isoform X2 [Hyperolius riggenbachi]